MTRILDFVPSPEEAVVSRVLVMVHQAVDEFFPSAEKPTRQFTKTLFSDDSFEKTAGRVPGAALEAEGSERATRTAFGESESTSPSTAGSGGAAAGSLVPPPPPPPPPQAAKSPSTEPPPARPAGSAKPPKLTQPETNAADSKDSRDGKLADAAAESKPASRHASTHKLLSEDEANSPDWVTRITLALLIAGLMLLAYVVFS